MLSHRGARGVAYAELSGDADSENDHGGSSKEYVLHRTGRTQEDDQLLRKGREWPDTTGRQGWIDPTRAGRLDEDTASAMECCHGGDDLQRLDLRSSASARRPDQGGSSVDAASDCSGQEEERPDRCQQDRRLPEMRFPPGVPHDAR